LCQLFVRSTTQRRGFLPRIGPLESSNCPGTKPDAAPQENSALRKLGAAPAPNGGVNPLTGQRVVSPYVVARTLSVMTSSGMYDFAGEWMYRVGIPAKSRVGGGILAALPSQLGLGTFSPRLDEYGNSVRGVLVCEELSKTFGPALPTQSECREPSADHRSSGR
jgi:Glutaminase